MKWIKRIAGMLGLMVLLAGLVIVGGRRLVAERLLSYYVGSDVRVETIAFAWLSEGKWQMHLRQIRIASTEPTIPFSPLHAEHAVLTFEGPELKKVEAAEVSVLLLRKVAGPQTVRNYQRLFPKRGRGRPIFLKISAQKVLFYLFNQPAELELQAKVERVSGALAIDSVWLRLDQAEADVAELGICYGKHFHEGLRQGRVRYAGLYRKANDSWESGFLRMCFPDLRVQYEGKIMRWAALQGGMQVWVDRASMKRWVALSPLAQSIMGSDLRASGLFRGDTVFFHAWGEGQWGQYEVCGTWADKRWYGLEGRLWQKPTYHLRAQSMDGEFWEVWGQGQYQSYPWQAKAHLSYSSGAGTLTFQLGELAGWYWGSLSQGNGHLQWRQLTASGTWVKEQGLHLNIDTVRWSDITQLLQAYQDFWKQKHEMIMPWRVFVQRLEIDKEWALQKIALNSQRKNLCGQGELRYQPWNLYLSLEFTAARDGFTGQVRARSPDDKVYALAEWRGDSVALSASGLLEGPYYGQVKGWGSLAQRRFWVEEGRLQSATGSYITLQGLVSDSLADASVRGEVFLPEILYWLPLKGIEIETGYLRSEVCIQEAWKTFLSWDNHAEGWTRLLDVRGRFLKTDLPLVISQVQVVFDAIATRIEGLKAQVGDMQLSGSAHVQGTLGYIYEDWRALQGEMRLSVDKFRLQDVWRIRKGGAYVPRLLLPEKMNLHADIIARDVDILGFRFNQVGVRGELSEQTVRLDRIEADYQGGVITGWGVLDAMDTACYMAAWQVRAERLPIQAVLTESGLNAVSAIQALGIQGRFTGEIQTAIRFAPNLTWKENSTLLAKGNISEGLFQTPSFFRWIRPLYIATYRDSMDFLAQVPEITIVDGYLRLHKSLVLTRIAAFTIEGTHLLSQDQFLYRIQGTRVYRKAQRYPHLARLSPYLIDRLTGSLWLIYIEKKKGRVRWLYPIKYLLRRLIVG